MADALTRILLEASLQTTPRKPGEVAPFDSSKLIALAKLLQAEIDAQEYAMNKVAPVDLYDEAGALHDHLSNFIAALEAADEPDEDAPYRRDPEFRAGGWGEV